MSETYEAFIVHNVDGDWFGVTPGLSAATELATIISRELGKPMVVTKVSVEEAAKCLLKWALTKPSTTIGGDESSHSE